MKKHSLATAIALAMGTAAGTASADTVMSFDYNGWFTMMDGGNAITANDNAQDACDADPDCVADWTKPNGKSVMGTTRTWIHGTMEFNLDTGGGTGTMVPFDFFNQTNPPPASVREMAMQTRPDGLVVGNMLFDWNGTYGIPVSIVLDASGMFGAVQGGLSIGDVVSGVGSLGYTDGITSTFTFFNGTTTVTGTRTFVMGPAPIATTVWNTTPLCVDDPKDSCLGVNPSGSVFGALSDDGIGGSPQIAGPFKGFSANFDVMSLTVTDIQQTAVPIPAAVWLFGSGLLGLVGVARRKKTST